MISSKASDPADGGENRGPRRPLRPLSTEVTASVADRQISATDALRAGYLRVTCCRVHGDVAARLVAEPSRWPILLRTVEEGWGEGSGFGRRRYPGRCAGPVK